MSKSLYEYRLERRFQVRLYIFSAMIFAAALIFVVQLGHLQIVNGVENAVEARKFVSRKEFQAAPRGLIYDRNYQPGDEPLVQNIRFIDFVIHPARFEDRESAMDYVKVFCSVMGRPFSEYAEIFEPDEWKSLVRKNESVTLITRMTRREQERLASMHISEEGGFVTRHIRYYTMGPAMAHVSGYIGLPSAAQLERKLARSYQTLGKNGMEARYDSELRGTDGVRLRHRIIDSEEKVAGAEQGNTLVLTIDREVQAAAYKALTAAGRRGAAIALNPGTGEVLALVSHPSYDPNILSSGTSDQRRDHLREVTRHKGFLNLAIQTKFPPASTFKPLVALAALEAAPRRDINRNTSYSCYGKFVLESTMASVPDTVFKCWNAGHGTNDMVGAIAHSCNVYFYNLGYHIGSKPIIRYARAFGLDKETGIDLPGEIKGRVPDHRWKQIHLSSRWFDGDTVNLAIGQGYLETTPMELAVMYAALVNRGKLMRPHLLKEVRDPIDGTVLRRSEPRLISEAPIDLDSLRVIQEGLRAVVTRGTARRLQAIPVPIAGKTGTAQTRSRRDGPNNAWFAGYAPYGAPPEDTVVVAVFVEHGTAGSASAAPVGGEMLRAAFPEWTPQMTRELELQNQRARAYESAARAVTEDEVGSTPANNPDEAGAGEASDAGPETTAPASEGGASSGPQIKTGEDDATTL